MQPQYYKALSILTVLLLICLGFSLLSKPKQTIVTRHDLFPYFQKRLKAIGFAPEKPDAKLAWKIYAEAFNWDLPNQIEISEFLAETGCYQKQNPEDSYCFLSLTPQFHFIEEESNLIRISIEIHYPYSTFSTEPSRQWWASQIEDLQESTSDPIFQTLMQSKTTKAILYADEG